MQLGPAALWGAFLGDLLALALWDISGQLAPEDLYLRSLCSLLLEKGHGKGVVRQSQQTWVHSQL
jgi:hypothetical protein